MRIWHSARLNTTAEDRVALLNNCLAKWVMPLVPQWYQWRRFVEGGGLEALTPREQEEAEAIMVNKMGDHDAIIATEDAAPRL